jgi:hypothetical protein
MESEEEKCGEEPNDGELDDSHDSIVASKTAGWKRGWKWWGKRGRVAFMFEFLVGRRWWWKWWRKWRGKWGRATFMVEFHLLGWRRWWHTIVKHLWVPK